MRSSSPSSPFRAIHNAACSGSIRSSSETRVILGLVSCAFVNAILRHTLVSMKNDKKLRRYTHTHTHTCTHIIYTAYLQFVLYRFVYSVHIREAFNCPPNSSFYQPVLQWCRSASPARFHNQTKLSERPQLSKMCFVHVSLFNLSHFSVSSHTTLGTHAVPLLYFLSHSCFINLTLRGL